MFLIEGSVCWTSHCCLLLTYKVGCKLHVTVIPSTWPFPLMCYEQKDILQDSLGHKWERARLSPGGSVVCSLPHNTPEYFENKRGGIFCVLILHLTFHLSLHYCNWSLHETKTMVHSFNRKYISTWIVPRAQVALHKAQSLKRSSWHGLYTKGTPGHLYTTWAVS